jgi:putative aldouronate transport system substrate-binding protein
MSRILRTAAVFFLIMLIASACLNRHNQITNHPKPLTVSIMVPLHQPQAPKDEVIQLLEQSSGASLDIAWIPDEVYRDKMINAMETNSLKKVTYVSQSDLMHVHHAIRSNVFWEIGPYLEEYPNLRRLDPQILNELSVNDKIYGLYSERAPSRQGILIRKDWLDRVGLPEPDSIDELYEIMKRFTLNDPDGDGKQDTIGLADRNDLIFGAFKTLSSYFGTPNNWVVVNNKLVPEFETPEYLNTMNFMKRLYEEKLMNSDFPVTSKLIQRYMLISGKAGVYVGNLSDAPRIYDEMKKLNPQAELTLVNRIHGPKGFGIWSIPSYSGIFLFSKKAIESEEELKSILAFFDRTMDRESSNLLQYGILGRHYILKDSKAVISNEMSKLRNSEILSLGTLSVAHLSNPNVYPLHEQDLDPLLMNSEELIRDNRTMLIIDPAQSLHSKTMDSVGAELSQIITNATYNYILGQIDLAGFRKEVESWRQRGGAQVIEELSDAYQLHQIRR